MLPPIIAIQRYLPNLASLGVGGRSARVCAPGSTSIAL
jgi:hypothetical protein